MVTLVKSILRNPLCEVHHHQFFATMSKKSEVDPASVKRKLTRPEKVPASGKKKKKETIQQQQQQQRQQVEGTIQQLELARLPGEEFVKTEVLMSSSECPFIPAPQPMIIDPPLEQDQAIQTSITVEIHFCSSCLLSKILFLS